MPLVPTRRLVLLALAPLALAIAVVLDRALVGPTLAADAALFLLAAVDAWLARGRISEQSARAVG